MDLDFETKYAAAMARVRISAPARPGNSGIDPPAEAEVSEVVLDGEELDEDAEVEVPMVASLDVVLDFVEDVDGVVEAVEVVDEEAIEVVVVDETDVEDVVDDGVVVEDVVSDEVVELVWETVEVVELVRELVWEVVEFVLDEVVVVDEPFTITVPVMKV